MRLLRASFQLSTLLMLVVLGISLLAGATRLIARDEGFYLYAARMVQAGFLPYRDFFFPQTPLAPLLFSAWFDLFGVGWIQGRLLASLLTALSGFLLFQLSKELYSTAVANLSLLFFGVSVGVMVWLPTAQTDCVSVPLLLASLLVARKNGNFFLAGAFFGFSVFSRLTIAPALLVLIVEAGRNSTFKHFLAKLWELIVGGMIPLLCIAAFALVDVENFFEHNLQYHLERTGMSPVQLSTLRWKVAEVLFGLRHGTGLGGLQFQIPLFAMLIGIVLSMWALGQSGLRSPSSLIARIDPFALTSVLLFWVHFLPEPTYVQYFCLVQIFLIPPASNLFLRWLNVGLTKVSSNRTSFVRASVVTIVLLTYTYAGYKDVERFFFTGEDVIGVGSTNRNSWTIHSVRKIGRMLDTIASPGENILSSWPGYCLETRAFITPGLESQFGPQWARNAILTDDEQRRRKILSWERAINRFKDGRAAVAVLFLGLGRSNNLEKGIIESGGKKVASYYGVRMYRQSGKSK